MIRSQDEESQCGQDTSPQEGVSCDGGPAEVNVCGSCGILYDSVVPNMHASSPSPPSKPEAVAARTPSAAAEDDKDVGSPPEEDEMRVLRAAPEVTSRPSAATLPWGHAFAASAAELDAGSRIAAVDHAAANLHGQSISSEADATAPGPRANSQRRGLANGGEKLIRREVAL